MPEWAADEKKAEGRESSEEDEEEEEPIDLTISVSTKKIPGPSLFPRISFMFFLSFSSPTVFPLPVVLFDYIHCFSCFSAKRYVVGGHARTAQLFP